MKKGAIFDMDGVLFDTERVYQEMWTKITYEFGYEPDPAFHLTVAGTSGEDMREIVRSFYPGIDAERFIHTCLDRTNESLEKMVPEKPGLREILTTLHDRGVRIAVASSSYPEVIRHHLVLTDVEKYFDVVLSGYDVPRGKPAPDIFQEAARRLGLEPSECYVFEDSLNGVRAGADAGCATIMVPDLVQPTEEIRLLCAGIYPTLHDALAAIETGEV